jgi:hypothetical protein
MSCPFYSKTDNECALLPVAPLEDDDQPEQDEPEAIDRTLCLDPHGGFRNCPIFRRRTIEQARAF